MSKTYMLTREQWVPTSIDEMFAFFSDASNLESITPPWLNFQILNPEPVGIAAGATIRYRLSWHGIPIRWKTEITRWEPPHAFEDVQLSGPYRLWHHTHRFEVVRGGTLMTDVVRYALPFGALGRAAHSLAVRRNVEQIFNYRYHRIHALFGDVNTHG
jgi:ligand-binding SRPBCC domain-containing protein